LANKKNQNSILFLTTLGVYIGLLMVGSTPGVIAQQGAMTRNFEISDEIEERDDLDTQPDPSQDELLTFEAVDAVIISSAVSTYLKLHTSSGKFPSAPSSSPDLSANLIANFVRLPRYLEVYPSTAATRALPPTALPRSGLDPLSATDA
jgi:hypothetical protein